MHIVHKFAHFNCRTFWLHRMFCTAEVWKIAELPELPLAVPDLNRLLAEWGGKRDDDFMSEGGKLQQRAGTHQLWIVNYPSFEWKLELKEHHQCYLDTEETVIITFFLNGDSLLMHDSHVRGWQTLTYNVIRQNGNSNYGWSYLLYVYQSCVLVFTWFTWSLNNKIGCFHYNYLGTFETKTCNMSVQVLNQH